MLRRTLPELREFQSTHPRGVRQAVPILYNSLFVVSIHAPARGATIAFINGLQRAQGFNPRTREGCDEGSGVGSAFLGCFNPRTREGCDGLSAPGSRQTTCFNPRTREGCDSIRRGHRYIAVLEYTWREHCLDN